MAPKRLAPTRCCCDDGCAISAALPVGLDLEAERPRLHHRFVNVELSRTGMRRSRRPKA
jgi:hypothetical protein